MTRKRTAPTYLKRTENGKAYAYCYLFGAQKRLGSYGTKDSFRRFEQCLAAFEQDNEELADYGHEPEREITVGELCFACPPEFQKLVNYVQRLTFEEKPDYNFMKMLITDMASKEAISLEDGMYDWCIKAVLLKEYPSIIESVSRD